MAMAWQSWHPSALFEAHAARYWPNASTTHRRASPRSAGPMSRPSAPVTDGAALSTYASVARACRNAEVAWLASRNGRALEIAEAASTIAPRLPSPLCCLCLGVCESSVCNVVARLHPRRRAARRTRVGARGHPRCDAVQRRAAERSGRLPGIARCACRRRAGFQVSGELGYGAHHARRHRGNPDVPVYPQQQDLCASRRAFTADIADATALAFAPSRMQNQYTPIQSGYPQSDPHARSPLLGAS